MKYLLIFAVVAVLAWHWRSTRRSDIAERKLKADASAKPVGSTIDMVPCAHCKVHVGLADSLSGRKGRYCSPEHRALAET